MVDCFFTCFSRGQLGHGDLLTRDSPTLVESLAGLPVTCISAGGWHSTASIKWGDLYTWGWNESGQLGIPHSEGVKTEPKLVEDIENVVSVSCGSRHTVALTSKLTTKLKPTKSFVYKHIFFTIELELIFKTAVLYLDSFINCQ